ncbi:hypothetical protein CASFOL_035351 [Castilleja foliolosa]|uniref:Non-structural maintenance of chromosomes element 4 n=1 Tax=Castilleja foliolosa TaxID=1961234 RepID=A0ABD3BTL2_9LAMI
MEMKIELEQERATEPEPEPEPVSVGRTIRSYYRQIENRINEEKDEISNVDSDHFMAIMNEVDNMHQHVNNPREQVADAEALLGLTSHLVASVKTHTVGSVIPAEFVSCLIRDFGQQNSMKRPLNVSRNVSWQNIGSLVMPIFMSAPLCMTMIGPLQKKLYLRKVRSKRSRTIAKARTKEVEKCAESISDTDKNILVMFDVLKQKKKARAPHLMLNRNSFAQTVENIFALSFLVKDGRVRIDVDENGSQVVVPTNGPSSKEITSGAVRNYQFIFRFDFHDWKLMKTLVPEGEEMMPQRDVFGDADYDNVKIEKS